MPVIRRNGYDQLMNNNIDKLKKELLFTNLTLYGPNSLFRRLTGHNLR